MVDLHQSKALNIHLLLPKKKKFIARLQSGTKGQLEII